MPIPVGTRLGPYEVVSALGAGGMGDVYRARDTKLGRDVAIKMIGGQVDSRVATLDRLQHEARTLASLNHPNIVTIHAIEEFDGQVFLAMELVEGRTLADAIVRGGVPLDTLLKYAIPLADALSAAHGQGIVHRDLKPSNVMIAKDERLKVLDFGLAKLRADAIDLHQTVEPTRPMTGQGQIVGTVSYMSPEQASGGKVDQRSDLFAVGVMLYEMATGERPFRGESSVSTLAAIIKDTPKPVTDLRPELPRELGRIIRRALAKDPEQRYQSAKDVRNDLQTLKDDLTSGDLSTSVAALTRKPSRSTMPLTIAAAAVAAIAIGAAVYFAMSSRTAPAVATELTAITRLTAVGDASMAAISPDGKYVAHVRSDRRGYGLWMRQTATSSDVEIVRPGPDRYIGVTFSPDANYVYYTLLEGRVTANVYRVPVLGGEPQRVIGDVDSALAFSRDGSQFAFVRGVPKQGEIALMVRPTDLSSAAKPIAARKFPEIYVMGSRPAWSPDGRSIAVGVGSMISAGYDLATINTMIVAVDVATGQEKRITERRWDGLSGVAWLQDGRTLVVSAAEHGKPNVQLWRVDVATGSISRLTNDLNNYQDVTAAVTAPVLTTVMSDLSSTISLSDERGSRPAPLTKGAGRYDGQLGLAWTPDGRLVFSSAVGGQTDLWIMDASGQRTRQLTNDPESEGQPVVTDDGRAVLFVSTKNPKPGIWRMALDSGALSQATDVATDMLPQTAGNNLVFTRTPETGVPSVFRVPLDGGTAVRISSERSDALSQDGRWVATFSIQNNRVVTFEVANGNPGGSFDILSVPFRVQFTPRGDALTFLESRRDVPSLWNQPLPDGKPTLLLDLGGDRIFNFAWSKDGKLAIAHGPVPSDVVLLSGVK
jgi:serine/threonine protein kinase/Tol biopolymer transport system component